MPNHLLGKATINSWLKAHPGWRADGEAITRTFQADSFLAGIDLVRRVADIAEQLDHHPDIAISWRTITFRLSTHSAGGVTTADLTLASVIDELS